MRKKDNPNTWKSLFLPLNDTEQGVYATTYDRSQKVALIKADASLCLYTLESASRGPHVMKNHVPTQARRNLCPDTAKALSACSWSQPRHTAGVAKSQNTPNPTEECLHGAVGLDSGHILLFDTLGGFHGGFSATTNLLPPSPEENRVGAGPAKNGGGSGAAKEENVTLKKEGIVAVSSVLGWYETSQCEQSFSQQLQGVASSYHRQGNSSFAAAQDFDSALDGVISAPSSGPRASAYAGTRVGSSMTDASMDTIEPGVGNSLNRDPSPGPYSPAEGGRLTPSTSPTTDGIGYGTRGGGSATQGVTGLVVATSGGSIIICRRKHPWDIFERCQLLVQSNFFSSAGAFASNGEAIFHCGKGKEPSVRVVHMSQKCLENPIELPGTMQKTTAMAADEHLCCAARNGVLYTIHYGRLLVTKLISLEEEVDTLNLRRPLVVAGCKSGRIAIICVDDGKLLSSTYTYNYSRPLQVTVDWNMLSVLVVDESRAVELLAFPEVIRRYSPEERFDLTQAKVMRRLIKFEEDSKAVKGCDNVEAIVLARSCVPEVAETYLSKRTVLP